MKEPSRFLFFLPDSSSFFPIFHDFFLFFPIFGKFFVVRGGTLPPLTPSGYATVNNIDCALMGYAILSQCIPLLCGRAMRRVISLYLSSNTSNLTNQTNLECIVFLKIPLSLDWSAQMRWDKDHNIDY